MSHVPDSLPDDMREQTCIELMDTIQNFCNESMLPRTEIVGALECVKLAMIRSWIAANDTEQ